MTLFTYVSNTESRQKIHVRQHLFTRNLGYFLGGKGGRKESNLCFKNVFEIEDIDFRVVLMGGAAAGLWQ